MIKRSGENVATGEVEAVIRERFRTELSRTAVGKIRKHVLRAECRSQSDDRGQ